MSGSFAVVVDAEELVERRNDEYAEERCEIGKKSRSCCCEVVEAEAVNDAECVE